MLRVLWIVAVCACGLRDTPAPETPAGGWANVAPAQVKTVLQGDGRLYLRVLEGEFDLWVAVEPLSVEAGDHVLMGRGPERRQFLSKDLGRRFEVMTFIEDIAVVTLAQSHAAVRLDPPQGGLSIGQVFEQRLGLDGHKVIVRGRVVAVNRGIFQTNWYHLVDGTGPEEAPDLTVTSSQDVAVGSIVRAEGVLTADKDLGFGYRYAAIIEDALLTAAP